jgi:uncharacterized membrane protein
MASINPMETAMLPISPLVMIHVATALLAVVSGTVLLMLKKGTALHRMLGRSWAVLMAVTALVSFGIQTSGHLSWIHLLSVLTLFILAKAIIAVRRGQIAMHLRYMRGAFIGLVVAGAFTLLPSRLLGHLVGTLLA